MMNDVYVFEQYCNPSQAFSERSSDYKLQNSIRLRVMKVKQITIVFSRGFSTFNSKQY